MKNNRKKQDKRKIISTILAVLMVIAMVLGMAAPFFASEINNNISIDAKIGFEQKYRIGANTPFSIFLKNDGKDFNGELQVKILLHQQNSTNEYSIYSHKVELPQGSTKTVNFNIVIPNLQKNIEISLIQNGTTIAVKNEICKAYSPQDTIIGVLTEDKDSLNYLKNLKIRNNAVEYNPNYPKSTQSADMNNRIIMNDALFFIDETSFPDVENIDFNAIIINNYDTEKLSIQQLNALKIWLSNGGNIIIGTGVNRDKVLKGLKDIIVIEDNVEKIPFESNEFSQLISYGSGKVLLHSFDLGLEPILSSDNAIQLLSSLYINNIPQISVYNKISNEISNNLDFSRLLSYIPIDSNNLSIKLIFLTVVIYILLLGPVLFIFLKRKDKLEKAWFIMPTLALGTTIFIYFFSFSTPYRKSIFNSISIINMQNNNNTANINTSVGILSPYKKDIDIKFDNKINVIGNSNYNNYYTYNDGKNIDKTLYKVSLDNKSEVTFYDNQSWQLNNLNLNTTKIFDGTVDINIEFNETSISAEITNNTGHNLEDAILTIGNFYAYYDYINDGETKEIFLKSTSEKDYYYNILKEIFYENNGRYSSYIGDKILEGTLTKERGRKILRRESLLSNIFNNKNEFEKYTTFENLNSGSKIKAQFYAFNNETLIDTSAKVNGKSSKNFNENLFTIDMELDLSKKEKFHLPAGIIRINDIYPKENIEQYNNYNTVYIYKSEYVECNFKLPENIKLEEFTINSEDPNYDMQIYNVVSDTWESLSKYAYSENSENYIKNNIITIKLLIKVKDGIDIVLPTLSIKGGN